MLVTLPFVLLLLDFWPLERMGTGGPARMRALAYEKLPLVGMALALSVVTFAVQRTSGMVKSTGHVKLSDRLGNAIISYVSYLGDMLWPLHLSVFYPHPQHLLVAKAASAAVLLLAITGAALACMRKAPYLPVGWFWYLGTLFPVIGVVQVGAQARADRYTYLPLIGICIMVAWGVPRLVERFRYKRQALAAASLVLLALCALLTWRQVGYWKDSETLYTRAMEAVPGNYWAHHHLANALRDSGRTDEALAHYEECVKLYPGYAPASYEMGIIQLDRGNYKEAEDLFARVVKTDFNPAAAHYYLGRALLARNRADDAMRHFSESVRIDPGLAQSHMDLGRILAGKGSLGEARRHLEQGLKIRPNDEAGQTDLGLVLLRQGRLNEAIGRFTIAAEINPRFEKARTLLQQATLNKAALESTIRTLEDRLGGAPPQAQAYGISSRLAVLYSSLGEYDRSAEHLFRMLDMRPGDPGVSYNLACVRARQGRKDEAVKYLRQAVEKGFADFRLIRTDPDLESIRSDPYVASLLKGR
jgi:tetratricopeptide (TPR) repeat protein